MMKIWIIVSILGQATETIGPVPYNMNECRYRVSDRWRVFLIRDQGDKNEIDAAADMPSLIESDIGMRCVEQVERPVLDLRPMVD